MTLVASLVILPLLLPTPTDFPPTDTPTPPPLPIRRVTPPPTNKHTRPRQHITPAHHHSCHVDARCYGHTMYSTARIGRVGRIDRCAGRSRGSGWRRHPGRQIGLRRPAHSRQIGLRRPAHRGSRRVWFRKRIRVEIARWCRYVRRPVSRDRRRVWFRKRIRVEIARWCRYVRRPVPSDRRRVWFRKRIRAEIARWCRYVRRPVPSDRRRRWRRTGLVVPICSRLRGVRRSGVLLRRTAGCQRTDDTHRLQTTQFGIGAGKIDHRWQDDDTHGYHQQQSAFTTTRPSSQQPHQPFPKPYQRPLNVILGEDQRKNTEQRHGCNTKRKSLHPPIDPIKFPARNRFDLMPFIRSRSGHFRIILYQQRSALKSDTPDSGLLSGV